MMQWLVWYLNKYYDDYYLSISYTVILSPYIAIWIILVVEYTNQMQTSTLCCEVSSVLCVCVRRRSLLEMEGGGSVVRHSWYTYRINLTHSQMSDFCCLFQVISF